MFLTGKELNKARGEIRKALKNGLLMAKRTYYDYYDSCHKPVETPDAPFQIANEVLGKDAERHFKVGYASFSLELIESNTYKCFNGYSTYIIKIIAGWEK